MKRACLLSFVLVVLVSGCGGHGRFDDPDAGTNPDPMNGEDGGTSINTGDGGAMLAGTCTEAEKKKGYAGCDFVFAAPPILSEYTRPPCFAALVANNSAAPAKLKVAFDGTSYDVTKFGHLPSNNPDPTTWPTLTAAGIPPKGVAILYLTHDPSSKHIVLGTPLACPGPTAIMEPLGSALPWPHRGKTFHVESDRPVTMYDVAPFGGAKSFFPSAELLLPTSAWGQSYVVATPPLVVPNANEGPNEAEWMRVVAKQDGTQVTVQGSTDLEGITVNDGVSKGTTRTVTLAAGEYFQWHSWRMPALSESITGTLVAASKPVAVFGGDMALRVVTADIVKTVPIKGNDMTPRYCCLDSAHQQIQPSNALGFDYVGAPYSTRRADLAEESILYRAVGVASGTTLAFDPPVSGAPSSLEAGQVVNFEAKGTFRVKSQDAKHPFFLSQTMSYSTVSGGTRRDGDPGFPVHPAENGQRETGDPEWVTVLPPAQFIREYAFVTDPTYGVTTLTITRTKENGSFADVNVDCIGKVTGFAPVGNGEYEVARVDLVRGGKGIGSCTNGAHTASSTAPFGVTVWGVDWWASYAYPAGGAAFQINDVVIDPK